MSDFVNKLKKYDDFAMLGGVSQEDIKKAEQVLGLTFAKEYREYLAECGVATAGGYEFTGIGKSERLNVVSVTCLEKSKNQKVSEELYAIENLGIDKIVIWQSGTGEVYQTVANSKPEKIADDLVDYLSL